MRIALLALLALPLAAQTTVTATVESAATDNASFRVLVTTSVNSWIALKYGTSTGSYSANTKSVAGTAIALSVGGLSPSRTYYGVACARPNPNDDTGVVCSSEFVVTTQAGTLLAPVAPTAWALTHPDFSSYPVVPIGAITGTTECGATQSVSNGSWSVTANSTMTSVLSTVTYPALLEIDPASTCVIPQDSGNNGYRLPAKALDSAAGGDINSSAHRWVGVRAKQVSAADLPPFGVRTGPQWAGKMPTFCIPSPGSNSGTGQFITSENGTGAVHHYWFENIRVTQCASYSQNADAVDPVAFQTVFRLGSQYQTANTSHIVLDRVFFDGQPEPIRTANLMEIGGNYEAVVGCYFRGVRSWRLAVWPQSAGSVSGGTISIPQNTYKRNNGEALRGMTSSATAVYSGSGTGTIFGNLYRDHLEVQYTSGSGTISCTGCTATATSTPSTPVDAFPLFTGTIAGGVISLNWNTGDETNTSRYVMAQGVSGSDLQAPGGPYLFDNTYMDGVGLSFELEAMYSNYSHDDLTFTRNHLIWPKNIFIRDPAWTGWRFDVRQFWEIKRGHRHNLTGNLFSYSWSFQNEGPAIFLSGRSPYNNQALHSGITDVTVKSNIVRHGRSAMGCMGVSPLDSISQDSDPQPTSRVEWSNNLMYDLSRDYYCDTVNCPGFQSPYWTIRPGCQNVSITNNTGGIIDGSLAQWLYLGGGTINGNYLNFQNNELYLSTPAASNGAPLWGPVTSDNPSPSSAYANHPVIPGTPQSNDNMNASFGYIPPFATYLSQFFAQGYTWKNNIAYGGYSGAAGYHVDLTSSEVAALVANMPAGTLVPAGNTIAAREASGKLKNPAGFDFRKTAASLTNPGTIGVDYQKLYGDAGIVSNIQAPLVSPTNAVFKYQAPDARSCYVDVSSNGTTWTRTTDAGGGIARTLTVTGLSAGTTYQSRILCYFEQQNDGVLYTEWKADEITRGTFATPAASSVTATVSTTLGTATKFRISLTPVGGGSTVTNTCTASTCSITTTAGAFTLQIDYLNSSNVSVRPSTTATVQLK